LIGFRKRINLSPDSFVQFAKDNPSAAEKQIISFLSQDKLQIEKGEIAAGAVTSTYDRIYCEEE
jgi:hypothetical protein